jgi:hypothetical protein
MKTQATEFESIKALANSKTIIFRISNRPHKEALATIDFCAKEQITQRRSPAKR